MFNMAQSVNVGERTYESTTDNSTITINDEYFALIEALKELTKEIKLLRNK